MTRFGRRPLLLVSYLASLIFAVLSAFSTSYVMFVILRFFTGMSLAGISIMAIVLSKQDIVKTVLTYDWDIIAWFMFTGIFCFSFKNLHNFFYNFFLYTCANVSADVEWFSIEHRTFSGVIISLDWTIGNWILVGTAYFVNEWRKLILAVTSPLILSIIAWRYLSFICWLCKVSLISLDFDQMLNSPCLLI